MKLVRKQSELAALFLSVAAIALAGCTAKSNYKTYEDCILSEVTANQTQAAVVAITHACRLKFPLPPLTVEEKSAQAAADAAAAIGDAAAADAAQAAADTAAAAADAAAASADERR